MSRRGESRSPASLSSSESREDDPAGSSQAARRTKHKRPLVPILPAPYGGRDDFLPPPSQVPRATASSVLQASAATSSRGKGRGGTGRSQHPRTTQSTVHRQPPYGEASAGIPGSQPGFDGPFSPPRTQKVRFEASSSFSYHAHFLDSRPLLTQLSTFLLYFPPDFGYDRSSTRDYPSTSSHSIVFALAAAPRASVVGFCRLHW